MVGILSKQIHSEEEGGKWGGSRCLEVHSPGVGERLDAIRRENEGGGRMPASQFGCLAGQLCESEACELTPEKNQVLGEIKGTVSNLWSFCYLKDFFFPSSGLNEHGILYDSGYQACFSLFFFFSIVLF